MKTAIPAEDFTWSVYFLFSDSALQTERKRREPMNSGDTGLPEQAENMAEFLSGMAKAVGVPQEHAIATGNTVAVERAKKVCGFQCGQVPPTAFDASVLICLQ